MFIVAASTKTPIFFFTLTKCVELHYKRKQNMLNKKGDIFWFCCIDHIICFKTIHNVNL